ncbi:hypothetical protein D3C76_1004820 [compost metagenome]
MTEVQLVQGLIRGKQLKQRSGKRAGLTHGVVCHRSTWLRRAQYDLLIAGPPRTCISYRKRSHLKHLDLLRAGVLNPPLPGEAITVHVMHEPIGHRSQVDRIVGLRGGILGKQITLLRLPPVPYAVPTGVDDERLVRGVRQWWKLRGIKRSLQNRSSRCSDQARTGGHERCLESVALGGKRFADPRVLVYVEVNVRTGNAMRQQVLGHAQRIHRWRVKRPTGVAIPLDTDQYGDGVFPCPQFHCYTVSRNDLISSQTRTLFQ